MNQFLEIKIYSKLQSKFHDQWDAKWIVIRGLLSGHNNMPFWVVGGPQGVFGGFSHYLLVMIIFIIVP
jgi:hypothetical protein